MFQTEFKNQKTNNSKRYRNWFITYVYKKDKGDLEKFIKSRIKVLSDFTYYVYQLERGNMAHKLHHHLFIRYKQPKTYNQIGKAFYSAHVQHISGPVQKVIKYCTKEKTRVSGPVEWGDLGGQGKRSDLAEIMEMVKCDWSNDQIAEVFPSQMFLYYQHIDVMRERYHEEQFAGKFCIPKVTYIYGGTGTGKTRYIYDNYKPLDIYRCTNYDNPFDMYKEQDVMVFDEFRSSIKLVPMLNHLDAYFTRLPARYHDKTAMYTKVYIISNEPFEKMYPDVQEKNFETYRAFCRRIETIKEFSFNEQGKTVIRDYGAPEEYYRKKLIEWDNDPNYLDYFRIAKLMSEGKDSVSKSA